MTASVTLTPAPGVSLGVAGDAVHAVPEDEAPPPPPQDEPDKQALSPSGSGAGGGVKIRRPRRPLDVWVTLVAPDIGPVHQDLLDQAPLFDSVELAIASQDRLPRSADGGKMFARVRASRPIQMAHVTQALEGLPHDSELIVSVEADRG